MPTRVDPFALLERTDKWYLGGGRAAIFAPRFPRWLDVPGFWDEAHFADIRLDHLYCILITDDDGKPVNLRRATRRWTPDRLTQIYTLEAHPGIRLQEDRVVTANDTLATRLMLSNTGKERVRFHVLAWSLQTRRSRTDIGPGCSIEGLERENDAVSFAHEIRYAADEEAPSTVYGWGADAADPDPHRLYVALGANRLPESWTINLAEAGDTSPIWPVSLFPEKFRNGSLPMESKFDAGRDVDGHVHIALHYVAELPAFGADTLTIGASIALDRQSALDNLRDDMVGDVVVQSRGSWERWFASVPYFECSDPFIETYYWYRWYGIRLSTVDLRMAGGDHHLPHPCVFEGVGEFRSHISYSAQCHLREASWMLNPAVAMGSIENFLGNQVASDNSPFDGMFPGHIHLWRRDRSFYHADWGGAALAVYHAHANVDFVSRIYPGLVRYAEFLARERDREGSNLIDVIDQGETGQEYMSRYLFADENADDWRAIRLKGVDATAYYYSLLRALAEFAGALGKRADAANWDRVGDAVRHAVRDTMWDEKAQIFKDTLPKSGRRSPSKAAVGFYPFMTDLAGKEHVGGLRRHLLNAETFGTPFPLPSTSADDPSFNADAEWEGKRHNCPWNGRVWPMTNSHVADALAHAGRSHAPDLRVTAAEFIRKFIRMMFLEGDPKRPTCCEHYNPMTGTPSLYRGVDDYQHSWVVDLIIRNVAGVQRDPRSGGHLVVDPLPFGIERFRLDNVKLRGRRIDVSWSQMDGFVVKVDGVERERRANLERVEISL